MQEGPAMAGTARRVGSLAYRKRWWVVAAWPLLLVALWGVASATGTDFRQNFALPGSETQAAADRLSAAGFDVTGGQQGMLVVAAENVHDPAVADAVADLLARIDSDVSGVSVVSPYTTAGSSQTSPDGSISYATLDLGDVPFSDAQARAEEITALRDAVEFPAGTQVELGGDTFAGATEFSSEAVGLVAAMIILLLAFGSVLAMGLPIATALFGIGSGVAVVTIATRWIDIPDFAPATVAMLGLGVGIDYALFIVARFREELANGADPQAAVDTSMATAGRSVVFAGTTVVTSLLGLLVVGLDDVQSLALAAAAGVGFVMLGSVTLLPALLGFVGHNIDRFGLPHRARVDAGRVETSAFYRWSRMLQRRPVAATVGSLLILLVLAAPVTSMRLGLTDASSRPETDTSRRAHDLVVDGFGPGSTAPLVLAIELSDQPQYDLATLDDRLQSDAGVDLAAPPVVSDDGATALQVVLPASAGPDPATGELVDRLRTEVAPSVSATTGADILVGGVGAAAVDFAAHNLRVLPWFIAVVLLLSFIVLLVLFRSVLVPLKAVFVNLLSVGAAYGVVVAVFQWGWLGGLFGLGDPGPIEAWVPMMLFAIVFGLSIDYEVFLLSRIKERFDATGDNAAAVADGLARTARLIAAAAAIMVCVFGAFAFSSERALQMLGLGLATAIAVDATLVRLVLVPGTMELLGARNWWLPGWLDRLLPSSAPGPGRRTEEPTIESA